MSAGSAYRRVMLVGPFSKAIADYLPLAFLVGLAAAAMGFAMGPMYLALKDALKPLLDQLPAVVLAMVGDIDMTTASGWYTGEMYSIVFPLAVIFVAAVSGARALGGEMERHTIGLVMSAPVRRTQLALDKAVAMIVHVIITTTIASIGVWLGAVVADVPLGTGGIAAAGLLLVLLAGLAGGIAMLVSIILGRGTPAILVALLAAIAAYAWSSFVPLADAIAELAWLSPWHHYTATRPLIDGLDVGSAAWLLILALVPLVLAVRTFRRRDIAA
jgi:ABC-type transport system involved in multi-copper enzyme maturation permease subunit